MYVLTHRLRLLPALVFDNVPHPTPHQGSGERREEGCKSERMESSHTKCKLLGLAQLSNS